MLFRNLYYLVTTELGNWLWLAAIMCGLLGLWRAYLNWYVSARRLKALESQGARFRDSNLELRNRIAQRNASKSRNRDAVEMRKLRGKDRLGEEVDDLTKLPGMTPAAAIKMRVSGIKRFSQLEELGEMNDEEREQFRARYGLRGVDFEKWSWIWTGGEQPDWEAKRSELIAEKDAVAASSDLESGTDDDDDEAGDEKDSGPVIEPYVAPGAVDFAGVMGREFAGEAVREDDKLGIIYDTAPAKVDNLKLVKGINPDFESVLNEEGVYRFKQVANWTDGNVESFAKQLDCPKTQIEGDRWVPQARELANIAAAEESVRFTAPADIDHHAVLKDEFAGEDAEVSSGLGVVYKSVPDVMDDLTLIDGIDEEMAEKLNQAGIYRFKQLANWTNGNVAEIAYELDIEKSEIQDDKWIPQAARLQREIYSASTQWGLAHPSLEDYEAIVASDFEGDDVTVDPELGIIFNRRPTESDNLSAIDGIEALEEGNLKTAGVYQYKQIAKWSEPNVDAFADKVGCSADQIYSERWIPQAAALSCGTVALEAGDSEKGTHPPEKAALAKTGRVMPLVEAPVEPFQAPAEIDYAAVTNREFGSEKVTVDDEFGILYEGAPGKTDDLKLIKGIGPKIEGQLNDAGVQRFKQMANWSDGNVSAFSDRLGCFKGRIERDRWVPQAREMADIVAAEESDRYIAPAYVDQEAILMTEFMGEEATLDSKMGIVYASPPEVEDDLTQIDGIDAEMAKKLNAAGVYRFKQLANWNNGNVAEFGGREGVDKAMIQTGKWIPQAKRLHREMYSAGSEWGAAKPSLKDYEEKMAREFAGENVRADASLGIVYIEKPSNADELAEVDGIGEATEARLNEKGVYRFNQIAGWSDANVEAYSEALESPKDRIYREGWIPQAAGFSSGAGPDSDDEAAEVIDASADLAKAGAIAPTAAGAGLAAASDRADESGAVSKESSKSAIIATGPQPEMDGDDVEDEETAFHAPKDVNVAVVMAKEFAKDRKVRTDDKLGILYDAKPDKVDNLQLIKGVGPKLETQLHETGVHRFKQVANWSDSNVSAFSESLGCFKGRIERDRWIPQARELADIAAAEESDRYTAPPYLDQKEIVRQQFEGEGASVDSKLGIVYLSEPEVQDDLTMIDGIDSEMEEKLNAAGIYRFKQLSNWTNGNVAEFADLHDDVDRGSIEKDKWIPQAKRLDREIYSAGSEWGVASPSVSDYEVKIAADYEGKDVHADENFGVLYAEKPPGHDDLTKVKGIGDATERKLNKQGIYTYQQLSGWSEANVDAVSELVDCPADRIYHDRWIPQAAALFAAKGDADHVPPDLEEPSSSEVLGTEADTKEAASSSELEAEPEADEEPKGEEKPKTQQIPAELASVFEGEEGAGWDDTLGVVFAKKPAATDQLTKINGVGRKTEKRLNDAGVYQYKQIAHWDDASIAGIADELGVATESQIREDNWVGQAQEFHGGPDAEGSTAKDEDSRIESEPDPEEKKEEAEAERPPLKDLPAEVAPNFGGEDVGWDDELGVLYARRPVSPDHLSRLEGIGTHTEGRLNDVGVYRYKQIANWSDDHVIGVARYLKFPVDQVRHDKWVSQAQAFEDGPLDLLAEVPKKPKPKAKPQPVSVDQDAEVEGFQAPSEIDYEAIIAQDFGGEEHVRQDANLGILYEQKPEKADDLKLIKGVGPKIEGQLNEFGVHRFKQVANWSDSNVAAFADGLNCFKGRIERDEWIPQAQELAGIAAAEEAESFSAPHHVDHAEVLGATFDGEEAKVDRELGIVYSSAPEVKDDLSQIDGIGRKMERRLNDAGIYRYKQLTSWSDDSVAGVAKCLNIPKGQIDSEKWIPQANRLHRGIYSASSEWGSARPTIADYEGKIATTFRGEDVGADEDFGVLYKSKPGHFDDFKEIKGIGPVFEGKLRDSGVECFKQIAIWSEANVEAFASELSCFRDRIYRDGWIHQAAAKDCGGTAPVTASEPEVKSKVEAEPEPKFDFPVTSLAAEHGDDVKVDEKLGLLFEERPDEVDDLKKIKGVGPKIESQLHEFGVYLFQQIAEWDETTAEEFSSRLSFKGRIKRENWIAQSKKFFEAKEK